MKKKKPRQKLLKVCEAVHYMNLADLRHHPKRIRTMDDEGFAQLRNSLLRIGLYRPMLVKKEGRKKGGVVLGGNQKLRVMRHLVENEHMTVAGPGGAKVPVLFFTGTDEQAEIVVMTDNMHSGDWDYMNLGEHLKDLQNRNIDPQLAGFSQKDIDDLVELANQGMEGLDELVDDDDKKKGDPSIHTFRFRVPKGEQVDMVKAAIEKFGGDHDAALVSMARIALEHSGE